MRGVVSSTGEKHRHRREWHPALLVLAAAWAVYVILRRANAPSPSYDASNVPGCVSQNQWKIEGDVPQDRLRYRSLGRGKMTDDKVRHEQFLARVAVMTGAVAAQEAEGDMYVTFSVFYRFDRGVYKQLASAIICKKPFEVQENECRNRSYFFFTHVEPANLADVLMADISSFTPLIRTCVWDRRRNSTHKPADACGRACQEQRPVFENRTTL